MQQRDTEEAVKSSAASGGGHAPAPASAMIELSGDPVDAARDDWSEMLWTADETSHGASVTSRVQ